MKKIIIPHIHKIEGEAGFWAEVSRDGKIEKLRLQTLLGLRQIEGILIGRRVEEVPIVVSRICGICPVVHILNACRALENTLEVKPSSLTTLLRKLLLAAQIVQSHALHLFFLALPDFFNIENDLDLMKRFKKEARAALKIREFSLRVTEIIGGRAIHPMRPQIGGFSKLPDKRDIQKLSKDLSEVYDAALFLVKTFQNLSYPSLQRKTNFVSLSPKKEYAFYQGEYILTPKTFSIGDFFSSKIEEDLRRPPVKRVKHLGKPYMLGAIARIKNNQDLLSDEAKKSLGIFLKNHNLTSEKFFENTFYNLFCQTIEILHFLKKIGKLIQEILKQDLKERPFKLKIQKGSSLSAMEAPRGTLFTYFEVDTNGRILDCDIITPTAQFLNNLEEDLKVYLGNLLKVSPDERIRKIRALIRAYDPCISCATH